jgi:uncharacterized protein
MAQRWHDLLFMHWPVRAEVLRELVPPQLPIDTFDGTGWLGVVPFWMSGVRLRGTPSLPWLSSFLELNVRTYVTVGGKPGVWFFSLDAVNPLAVEVARRCYRLPYYRADMWTRELDGVIRYRSERTHRGAPPAAFRGSYRPVGAGLREPPGSLARWLTDRYSLYVVDRRGRVRRQEIDHTLWPLHDAEAEIAVNSMASAAGIDLPDTAPVLHFSRRLDVIVWPSEIVSGADPR